MGLALAMLSSRSIATHTAAHQQSHGGPHFPLTNALNPCWCFCEDLAGLRSQSRGLAQAVGLPFEVRSTTLKPWWRCLPLSWVPRNANSIRDPGVLDGPPPRLVISCGKHGIIPALTLKRRYGDQVCAVHVQDPNIDPKNFDLVVVPQHDRTRGPNVYLSLGALHHVNSDVLEAARSSPEATQLELDDRPLVTVLLGGQNRYYGFTMADMDRLIGKLHQAVRSSDAKLAILKSRRTPDDIAARFQHEFGNKHYIWNGQTSNPYLAALSLSSHIIATGDSVSMITESSATGRPVFVEQLTEVRRAVRFRRFHEQFEEAGITRRFEGRLDDWTYEIPRDTERVAQLIRERIRYS